MFFGLEAVGTGTPLQDRAHYAMVVDKCIETRQYMSLHREDFMHPAPATPLATLLPALPVPPGALPPPVEMPLPPGGLPPLVDSSCPSSHPSPEAKPKRAKQGSPQVCSTLQQNPQVCSTLCTHPAAESTEPPCSYHSNELRALWSTMHCAGTVPFGLLNITESIRTAGFTHRKAMLHAHVVNMRL